MTPQELAQRIDHTQLKPETTDQQIRQLCDEAAANQFISVCVNPCYVKLANDQLSGSGVRVASVAGFPLGTHLTTTKADEAARAIEHGATEIDMVVHVAALMAGEKNAVRDDIAAVADIVHQQANDGLLKVILETALLNEEQIALGCRCSAEAQADFVKTSTGFHPAGGASLEAVQTLRRFAAPIKVKASGGIRDYAACMRMIEAGADRIGTSSGVAIIDECKRT